MGVVQRLTKQGRPARSKPTWALWTVTALLEAIDLLIYGTFGLGILFASVLKVATLVLKTGSQLLAVGCSVLLIALIAACIRDVVRRRWGLASKGLVAAWLLCALYGMLFLG